MRPSPPPPSPSARAPGGVASARACALVLPDSLGTPDQAFWCGVWGGARALREGDAWMAMRVLDALAAEVMAPLAAQLPGGGTDPRGAHPPGAPLPVRAPARGDEQADRASLARAFLDLLDDYRRLQAALGRPATPNAARAGEIETALRALAGPASTLAPRDPDDLAVPITERSLSVVLPAYNEEGRIARTVHECLETAGRCCPNVEVIVVDDGGRDRTGAIVDELALDDARVVAMHHPVNRGYGAALLTGFATARGDLLFFMDSDGQFDIREIAQLLEIERKRPGAAVLGYRKRRRDAPVRSLYARGWKLLTRVVVGLRGIRDIDCAFKLLPAELVRRCDVTAQGAMVNTELLLKLQKLGVPLVQVPVSHYPRAQGRATGANPRVILKALHELLRLRRRIVDWHPDAAPLDDVMKGAPPHHATRA